jgi:hypothetical protein
LTRSERFGTYILLLIPMNTAFLLKKKGEINVIIFSFNALLQLG